jgi:succinoglycan biosynthesis transport protein ExoP
VQVAYSDQFPVPKAVAVGRSPITEVVLNPALFRGLIVHHSRRIAVTACACFIVLGAVIALIAPHYSGVAIVLVDPRQQRVLQSDAVLPGIGNDMAAVDSQVEVIQSAPIALKVIADLKLDEDPEFAPSSSAVMDWLRAVVGERRATPTMYALSRFAGNLKVRRRGLTYILEIEFLSRSARKSAVIANAVANAYIDLQATTKSGATTDASKLLANRLGELRRLSREADAAVAKYKDENGLVGTGEKRSVVEQQLSDTNQQLTLARLRTEEARSRLKQIEKVASDPSARNSLVDALSSPVIAGLRAQYAVAAKSAAELAQSLGPRHPAIKASDAELAAINRQIELEIGRLSSGVRNEYDAAQARERSLEASLARLKVASASDDQSTVRLHELERESEAAQDILQRSLVRYKETIEQESAQTADVRIVSPATVPLRANGPNRKLLLAIAAIASMLFGVLLTALREGEPPVKGSSSARDADHLMSMPTLGYLPDVRGRVKRVGRTWRSRGELEAASGEPLDRDSLKSSFAQFQEAIRRLASNFISAHPQRPYVVAFTGASRRNGVSTVAAAFAHSLAKSGNATLLVDAALKPVRSGNATRRFGLLQSFQRALSVDFAITKGGDGEADVLHCGLAEPADFSLVSDNNAIEAALSDLRSRYGVVVLDTGATIADPQGQRLVALANSAVLVLAADELTAPRSGAALSGIERCGDKIEGAVINKVGLDVYQVDRRRSAAPSPSGATATPRWGSPAE